MSAIEVAMDLAETLGEQIHVLTDDYADERKRTALLDIITAAYAKGYEAGLYKGGKLMVQSIKDRLHAEPVE